MSQLALLMPLLKPRELDLLSKITRQDLLPAYFIVTVDPTALVILTAKGQWEEWRGHFHVARKRMGRQFKHLCLPELLNILLGTDIEYLADYFYTSPTFSAQTIVALTARVWDYAEYEQLTQAQKNVFLIHAIFRRAPPPAAVVPSTLPTEEPEVRIIHELPAPGRRGARIIPPWERVAENQVIASVVKLTVAGVLIEAPAEELIDLPKLQTGNKLKIQGNTFGVLHSPGRCWCRLCYQQELITMRNMANLLGVESSETLQQPIAYHRQIRKHLYFMRALRSDVSKFSRYFPRYLESLKADNWQKWAHQQDVVLSEEISLVHEPLVTQDHWKQWLRTVGKSTVDYIQADLYENLQQGAQDAEECKEMWTAIEYWLQVGSYSWGYNDLVASYWIWIRKKVPSNLGTIEPRAAFFSRGQIDKIVPPMKGFVVMDRRTTVQFGKGAVHVNIQQWEILLCLEVILSAGWLVEDIYRVFVSIILSILTPSRLLCTSSSPLLKHQNAFSLAVHDRFLTNLHAVDGEGRAKFESYGPYPVRFFKHDGQEQTSMIEANSALFAAVRIPYTVEIMVRFSEGTPLALWSPGPSLDEVEISQLTGKGYRHMRPSFAVNSDCGWTFIYIPPIRGQGPGPYWITFYTVDGILAIRPFYSATAKWDGLRIDRDFFPSDVASSEGGKNYVLGQYRDKGPWLRPGEKISGKKRKLQ